MKEYDYRISQLFWTCRSHFSNLNYHGFNIIAPPVMISHSVKNLVLRSPSFIHLTLDFCLQSTSSICSLSVNSIFRSYFLIMSSAHNPLSFSMLLLTTTISWNKTCISMRCFCSSSLHRSLIAVLTALSLCATLKLVLLLISILFHLYLFTKILSAQPRYLQIRMGTVPTCSHQTLSW